MNATNRCKWNVIWLQLTGRFHWPSMNRSLSSVFLYFHSVSRESNIFCFHESVFKPVFVSVRQFETGKYSSENRIEEWVTVSWVQTSVRWRLRFGKNKEEKNARKLFFVIKAFREFNIKTSERTVRMISQENFFREDTAVKPPPTTTLLVAKWLRRASAKPHIHRYKKGLVTWPAISITIIL